MRPLAPVPPSQSPQERKQQPEGELAPVLERLLQPELAEQEQKRQRPLAPFAL
jgi:hypothetical protein